MNVKGVQCYVVLFLMQNEGSVQDMRRNLIIKAFVLGAVGCAFTITGMAANGHGQGIADSTTEVNAAKHEAVRSNWMDRIDIVVGVGMKDSKEMHTQHHTVFTVPRTDLHTVTSKNSKSTEINKLYSDHPLKNDLYLIWSDLRTVYLPRYPYDLTNWNELLHT